MTHDGSGGTDVAAVDPTPIDPASIVGIVGAGTMGAGIAQVAATAGHDVWIADTAAGAADRAVASVGDRLDHAVERGRMSREDAARVLARLHVAGSLDQLAPCGLVVEAVIEDLSVKQDLFAALEASCAPDAILASNTSSLSVTDLAAATRHPERVAGMHFFNPAPLLPLVEVVSGRHTAPSVAGRVAAYARAWGKTPVHATSTPGFIVNRVARPFYAEGFGLLESGVVDPPTLDALMREAGGFRMGPCELSDLIGQDVNAAVTRSVWEAFGRDPRFAPSALQASLVEAGRLGRKSGRGWYDYEPGADAEQVAAAAIRRETRSAGPAEVAGDDRDPTRGWRVRFEEVELRLTDGRTAAEHSTASGHPVMLVDLALDLTTAGRVAVAAPPDAPEDAVSTAVGYLQGRGHVVTVLPDSPGLVVARTVAMLAAFAADTVDAGVAGAADVDTAMRLGTNYPAGPYAWGERLGWAWVAGILDTLAAATGDGAAARRYRVSPGLRRRAGQDGRPNRRRSPGSSGGSENAADHPPSTPID